MADQGRFDRNPNSPSRILAKSLALADQEFRLALIEARRAAGLSQQDVAEALGITQSAVSQFERYDNDPQLSTVRRYALAVGAAVSHRVTDATGAERLCGDWTTGWRPLPEPANFAVTPGQSQRIVALEAPTSVGWALAA